MEIYVLLVLGLAFATEAVVQLVIKSEFFAPIRRLASKLGPWTAELFQCGYCFSVWVALGMISVVPAVILPVSDWRVVNVLLTLLVIHRLSNIMHNVIDKWTDKYYDMRYVNTDKN
jgi:hypothetical protein